MPDLHIRIFARRRFQCAVVLACACALVCVPGPTHAQEAGDGTRAIGPGVDWSLAGRVTHRITGDINRDLEPGEQEALLTNALTAGLVLDAETKTALLSVDLGLTASHFIGEDPDLDGETRIDPSLNLRGIWRGKRSAVTTELGLDVQEASVAQIDDTGIAEADTTQFTVTYAVELEQQIDAMNTLSIGSSGTAIDFSEDSDTLIPSRTFGVTVGWERRLTETSTVTFETGLRRFTAEDATDTRSNTLDLSAGLSHRRTARHTFGGSLGLSIIQTEQTGAGTTIDFAATGGASFEYLLENLSTTLEFSQAVEPSSDGELQAFSRFSAGLAYEVTRDQTINLSGTYSRRSPLGSGTTGTLDFFQIGGSYVWDVTEATQLSLGYSFQGSNDSATGSAHGHQVFLSATRTFDVIP